MLLANFSQAGIPRDMGHTVARQTHNIKWYGENSPMNVFSKEGAEIRHLSSMTILDYQGSAMKDVDQCEFFFFLHWYTLTVKVLSY